MKNLLIVIVIVSATDIFAQNSGPNANTPQKVYASFDADRDILGRAREIKRTGKVIDGSKHLWDGWNNAGIVEAANGKKYNVKNINFNAKNNWFEVNVHKDSTYAFDRRKVNKVIIDERTFVNLEFPKEERAFIVEEVAKGTDFAIVKKYDVEVLYGSHDPMRGSSRDKYKKSHHYYIKNNEGLENFKIKKSTISKLYGKNAKKVEAYAKDQKLSFKNDMELGKIISYANTL